MKPFTKRTANTAVVISVVAAFAYDKITFEKPTEKAVRPLVNMLHKKGGFDDVEKQLQSFAKDNCYVSQGQDGYFDTYNVIITPSALKLTDKREIQGTEIHINTRSHTYEIGNVHCYLDEKSFRTVAVKGIDPLVDNQTKRIIAAIPKGLVASL